MPFSSTLKGLIDASTPAFFSLQRIPPLIKEIRKLSPEKQNNFELICLFARDFSNYIQQQNGTIRGWIYCTTILSNHIKLYSIYRFALTEYLEIKAFPLEDVLEIRIMSAVLLALYDNKILTEEYFLILVRHLKEKHYGYWLTFLPVFHTYLKIMPQASIENFLESFSEAQLYALSGAIQRNHNFFEAGFESTLFLHPNPVALIISLELLFSQQGIKIRVFTVDEKAVLTSKADPVGFIKTLLKIKEILSKNQLFDLDNWTQAYFNENVEGLLEEIIQMNQQNALTQDTWDNLFFKAPAMKSACIRMR